MDDWMVFHLKCFLTCAIPVFFILAKCETKYMEASGGET